MFDGKSQEQRDAQAQSPPEGATGGAGAGVPAVSLRKIAWAALAALCVAAGVVASIVGAHAVARTNTNSERESSQQTSAGVASALKLAIQHEEELRVGGATFLAGDSRATPAEFDRWAKWAQTLRRYPELQQLGVIALVTDSDLPAFAARAATHTLGPSPAGKRRASTGAAATTSATSASAATTSATATTAAGEAATAPVPKIRPAGTRPYYCLAVTNLVRRAGERPARGLDYCEERTGLLLSRDSGFSHYTALTADGGTLEVLTPVYRGNQPPATHGARIGAFAGWLRQVFVPGVLLRSALQGHAGAAARMSFHSSTADVTFAAGAAGPGTPTTAVAMHDGWTVQAYGAAVGASSLSHGDALALLIVGCVLSAAVGLLLLVLGVGRPAVRALPPRGARAQAAQELHDPLTGLPSRALMMDRAECMLARANRQSGLLVGALFIDIDWFTDVNDRLGRAAGDQILKIVAERLENVVRAGDTVGRLDDDEFVLLVESAARGARLDSLAMRVVEALHKPFELDDFGPNFFLTASIGVAFGRYASPEDLLRDAQLALFAAKSAGKDRYTLFNANMRSVIEGRGVLEAELNRALAEKQFFLLYEPVYDLETGAVAGLEALVRWAHPKQGVLGGEDFIALAEETGLTVPIGRWAMEEACTRAAAWDVAGHHVGVSVEVTPNQLNRDGFVTDVRRALQQSGIDPSLLTLQIAETTVMRDVSAAVERLQEIKELGVRVAIDDFGGSGYAYHSDLRRLPLDDLKVDRGSLAAAEDEDYRTWLLEAIMIVGRELSLRVIAKGIDSYEQMTALQSMGCTMAQGALMGKPVAADAVEGLLGASLPTVRADPQNA
ncbi:MAG TPA: EAL domain-containing protein [Solirubrobacteraceae bacterium]|nr:EAL domain-containing protein [Solirubrobacteraceae bacterium]